MKLLDAQDCTRHEAGAAHGEFVFDHTASGHRRVTCKCGATLVKQPYMTEMDWERARLQFGIQHMTSTVGAEPLSGSETETCDICAKPIKGHWNICAECFHALEQHNAGAEGTERVNQPCPQENERVLSKGQDNIEKVCDMGDTTNNTASSSPTGEPSNPALDLAVQSAKDYLAKCPEHLSHHEAATAVAYVLTTAREHIAGLQADCTKLHKALSALVGANTEAELALMEAAVRNSPVPIPEEDRACVLNAINVLRDRLARQGSAPGVSG